jgi:CSLREA domain-containing protein
MVRRTRLAQTRQQRRAIERAEAKQQKRSRFGAAILGVSLLAPAAGAATIVVNTTADTVITDGKCSLREALQNANNNAATNIDCVAGSGLDTISLSSVTGTITLANQQLAITEGVTITGPGQSALTIDAHSASRVFYAEIPSGTPNTVTISGMTVTHGNPAGAEFDAGGGIGNKPSLPASLVLNDVTLSNNIFGGALWSGPLTVRGCTFSGNTGAGLFADGGPFLISRSTISGNSGSLGGGLILYSVNPGTTGVVEDTTISGNTASSGAGVVIAYEGSITISRSTISGNRALETGGGIAIAGYGHVLLDNVTVTGNTAKRGGGISVNLDPNGSADLSNVTVAGNSTTESGGNLYLGSAVTIRNSIIANGTAPLNPDISVTGPGVATVAYSDVAIPGNASLILGSGVINTDPKLGPLADNGGPTKTLKPGSGSPVINAGDPTFTQQFAIDQAGHPRVSAGRLDMGALEDHPAESAPHRAVRH